MYVYICMEATGAVKDLSSLEIPRTKRPLRCMYVYMYIHTYRDIYIYIYIERERKRDRDRDRDRDSSLSIIWYDMTYYDMA